MSSLKEKGANISSLKNDLRLLLDKYKGVTINDMLDAVKEQETESNEQQYCDMVFWQ